jgi:hypothetical protein
MDDHLDMHFMQNSRNDQAVGRGHSRSWFVGFEVCSISSRYSLSHSVSRIGCLNVRA